METRSLLDSEGPAAATLETGVTEAAGTGTGDSTALGERLIRRYREVRGFTESLCEPLATEDFVVQTRENVSPTKWHLAHVSWFFETFLLQRHLEGYEPIDPDYAYLFNSYYVQAGERHCRDRRGWISRPTVEQVFEYRAHVDEHMVRLIRELDAEELRDLEHVVVLGTHHEQQHQELLLMDIKHVLSVNPLRPAYSDVGPTADRAGGADTDQGPRAGGADTDQGPRAGGEAHDASDGVPPLRWVEFQEGVYEVGHDGDGFSYDNERPRNRVYVQPFRMASRLVTNGEWLEFMADGGYERPELWLSDGWTAVQEREWTEPFYWERREGRWMVYTLGGLRPLDPATPVCHVTYYEADAFARWAEARLPTEEEWEVAAVSGSVPVRGNFVETGELHPTPAPTPAGRAGREDTWELHQMYGDVWEWTRSQYEPYPGFEPLQGALGEYNGKFMCDQFVLRGGCCVTSVTHVRSTYRNFFHADESWQFSGLRLARDA